MAVKGYGTSRLFADVGDRNIEILRIFAQAKLSRIEPRFVGTRLTDDKLKTIQQGLKLYRSY